MNNAPAIHDEHNEARTQRNMRLSCLALGITLVFVLISRSLPEIYQWYLLGVATSFLLLFGVMISPLWKEQETAHEQVG
jgi:high-affinity K+ transport system ATPase subunit B